MVTVVAFHAHPDDEVILTGGTLARLAAEGHRVVIVVATSGAMRFVRADPAEAAEQLASILRAESADLLLSYDPVGGYGHRDHIRVHKVGALAAQLAGVRVLEATAPRELAIGALAVLTAVRLVVRHPMRDVPSYGAPRSAITRRVNVRRHAAAKRAAFAVHITPLNGKGRVAADASGGGTTGPGLRTAIRPRVVRRPRRWTRSRTWRRPPLAPLTTDAEDGTLPSCRTFFDFT